MWLARLDRRLGAAARGATRRLPGGPAASRALAGALSPSFRLVVAVLVARRATRRAGLEALGAAVTAALAARLLRRAIGRARPPGAGRQEGGFPSRHGAAAAAIARAAGRRHPRVGAGLAIAAALGGLGRVAAGVHEPADVVAGAGLGLASDLGGQALARRAVRLRACGRCRR